MPEYANKIYAGMIDYSQATSDTAQSASYSTVAVSLVSPQAAVSASAKITASFTASSAGAGYGFATVAEANGVISALSRSMNAYNTLLTRLQAKGILS